MKRTLIFLLAAVFCLSGCSELEGASAGEENATTSLGGLTFYVINVKPQIENRIGKEGGDFVITLSLPEASSRTLKNEYFSESYNLDADFVKIKSRRQVNERMVEYTFTFEENKSGQERYIATRVYDTTYATSTIRGGVGSFLINQSAE